MAQQTAVEWLMNELDTRGGPDGCSLTWKDLDNLIELARQMEKDQMIDLIRFLRTQDKMGKSVEDLYEQYKNK